MRTDEILARVREGKTYEEQQAIALELYNENHPPLTSFDLFMNYAIFFGPFVIGILLAWLVT